MIAVGTPVGTPPMVDRYPYPEVAVVANAPDPRVLELEPDVVAEIMPLLITTEVPSILTHPDTVVEAALQPTGALLLKGPAPVNGPLFCARAGKDRKQENSNVARESLVVFI